MSYDRACPILGIPCLRTNVAPSVAAISSTRSGTPCSDGVEHDAGRSHPSHDPAKLLRLSCFDVRPKRPSSRPEAPAGDRGVAAHHRCHTMHGDALLNAAHRTTSGAFQSGCSSGQRFGSSPAAAAVSVDCALRGAHCAFAGFFPISTRAFSEFHQDASRRVLAIRAAVRSQR